MSKHSDKKSKREKLPSDPYWHLGEEEDLVSTDQQIHWNGAILEAIEQVWVTDDPEIQVPRLFDDDGNIVQDNSTRPRMSCQWVAAPVLERIAAFLQRGDPIKPGLAKIIGRLLAGEPFFSPPPFGVFCDSYQFDSDGNIVRDDTKITKFTLEAWTIASTAAKSSGPAEDNHRNRVARGGCWMLRKRFSRKWLQILSFFMTKQSRWSRSRSD